MIPDSAMRGWMERARGAGILAPDFAVDPAAQADPAALAALAAEGGRGGDLLFPSSVRAVSGATLAACMVSGEVLLGVFGPGVGRLGFAGAQAGEGALFCRLDSGNAAVLRRLLPFTAPAPLAGRAITVGLGDRLGIAGPGHIRACRGFDAAPVLAQQSVRELDLMGRDYPRVLDAATWAVFQEGYALPWGADADHVKTEEWVRTALAAGFTMITADVGDSLRSPVSSRELHEEYARLDASYRRRIETSYRGRRILLDTGDEVSFSADALASAAVSYRGAVEHAVRLYRAAAASKGDGGFDFELSVDETGTATTLTDHAFVALEARAAGVRLGSLAPRFVGEFQKGIDYRGDPAAFAASLAGHAALARVLGHRLSVHSGSDKFALFPAIGRLTGGRFHIKTSGTSWLEALRVTAVRDPVLFREMYGLARERFPEARRLYHVTPDLGRVPSGAGLADGDLPGLLDQPDVRQVLHVSYGELLREPAERDRFFASLAANREAYWDSVERHIRRHLEALGVPRAEGS